MRHSGSESAVRCSLSTVDVRQYQSNFGQVGCGRGGTPTFSCSRHFLTFIYKKMYMKLNNNRLPSPLFGRNISEREIRETRVKLKLKEYYAPPPPNQDFHDFGIQEVSCFLMSQMLASPTSIFKNKTTCMIFGILYLNILFYVQIYTFIFEVIDFTYFHFNFIKYHNNSDFKV